jgi:predicted  nucleic acid-binding Zn-ribbon protein
MNKRTVIIAFVLLLLVAGGVIYYLYNSLSSTKTEMEEMVEMMNYEKEQLENEYADVALEIEGMSIRVNNDSLLSQLDKEQKRVQLLLEELRTVKATNARRIAELKEELSTVRKVLVSYVRQVDSLTAVNTKLEAENRQV